MKDPGLKDRIKNDGAGYRNHNPGNRTKTDSVFGSGVDTSGTHVWTKYSNWENGYAGNCLLLLKYLDGTQPASKYGIGNGNRNPCMLSIIYTWCPPTKKNNSSGYVRQMCNWLGVEPDDRIAITENTLFCIELAKGCYDSGCVQREACRAGVKKCISYYLSNGGHLDTNENLGKIDAELYKQYENGYAVNSGGSSSSSDITSASQGLYPQTVQAINQSRPIMESKGGNVVYRLSSRFEIETDERGKRFENMVNNFTKTAPELGRTIIISTEQVGSEILKSGQKSKVFSKSGGNTDTKK